MAYKCEILADSISEQGHRLTTFKLTYPRIIHAEMLRHRMLSRNVASSRAIPFKKMVKDVEEDPFTPIAFQRNHKGMQGTDYLTGEELELAKDRWNDAKNYAIMYANDLFETGATKQLCNRVLEPFVWTTELVSGTEWENFFELRCPKYQLPLEIVKSKKEAIKLYPNIYSNFTELDWLQINKSQAEIHIQKIAEMMWDTMNESVPKTLKEGQWHIPYGDTVADEDCIDIMDLLEPVSEEHPVSVSNMDLIRAKIATARAARISYTTLGDNPKIDYEADIKLHDRLLESKHLSPFEHCARAMSEEEFESFYSGEGANNGHTGLRENQGWCNNYRGFIQYRYLIENQ